MAEKIDPDDLVDAGEVAELLDLSRRQAVSTYRTRYADFPAPVVSKNSGKCDLWLRADIQRWLATTGVWKRHLQLLEDEPEYAEAYAAGGRGEPNADRIGHPRSGLLDRAWRRGRAMAQPPAG